MSNKTTSSDRFERAIENSAIVGAATRTIWKSRFITVTGHTRRIEKAVGHSVVRRYLDRFNSGRGDAMATATVVTVASTIARLAHASFVYRWLTAEPEPEVIVIDLRDTVTVGPVVAAMDASFEYLDSWLASSVVARRADQTIAILRQRPLRAASVTVFAAATANFLASAATGTVSSGTFLGYVVVLALSFLGYRDTRSWDDVKETRPARLLVALLEPPEPPGDGSRDEQRATRRDESEE